MTKIYINKLKKIQEHTRSTTEIQDRFLRLQALRNRNETAIAEVDRHVVPHGSSTLFLCCSYTWRSNKVGSTMPSLPQYQQATSFSSSFIEILAKNFMSHQYLSYLVQFSKVSLRPVLDIFDDHFCSFLIFHARARYSIFAALFRLFFFSYLYSCALSSTMI